jgi:hypothetical protein
MPIRMNIELSENAERALDELKATLPKTEAQKFKEALSLARFLLELETRTEVLVLRLGRLEITNDAYRLERQAEFIKAISELPPSEQTAVETFYNSLQLKLSFFGMGIDLKPTLERLMKRTTRSGKKEIGE